MNCTFIQFVLDNKKAQKTLIGAFEILVGKVYPALMPRVPHILKTFYDEDIIEEEVILEWNDKVRIFCAHTCSCTCIVSYDSQDHPYEKQGCIYMYKLYI